MVKYGRKVCRKLAQRQTSDHGRLSFNKEPLNRKEYKQNREKYKHFNYLKEEGGSTEVEEPVGLKGVGAVLVPPVQHQYDLPLALFRRKLLIEYKLIK